MSESPRNPLDQEDLEATTQTVVNPLEQAVVRTKSAVEAPKKSSNAKPVLLGAIGGFIASAALTAGLALGGVINVNKTQQASSSGQNITIQASGEQAELAQAVSAKALPSVVGVHVSSEAGSVGLGSGVILDKSGNIITNYHVIADATEISVTIQGKSYSAELVGSDPSSDIAVIKADLKGAEVTPIEVGNSDDLKAGSWVMTVGSPFGLDQSVSVGIVSAISRNTMMQTSAGRTLYTNLIQTDASINQGNSGGALVNEQGQLVGISTLFSSYSESFSGIGFAIPGNYAVKIASTLVEGKQVVHAYIGLNMVSVNAQSAKENNLPVSQGAYIASVEKNSPAEAAGLKEGDIITGFGDDEISSADGMILSVRSHNIGDTVEVRFNRDGKEMTAKVTLGDDAELQKRQSTQGSGDTSNDSDLVQKYLEYLQNNH